MIGDSQREYILDGRARELSHVQTDEDVVDDDIFLAGRHDIARQTAVVEACRVLVERLAI